MNDPTSFEPEVTSMPERCVGDGCACRRTFGNMIAVPRPAVDPVAAAKANRPEWSTVADHMERNELARLLAECTEERDRARAIAVRLWSELEEVDPAAVAKLQRLYGPAPSNSSGSPAPGGLR